MGTNVFAYTNVGDSDATGPTSTDTAIRAQHSSCNFLTITYAISNNAASAGSTSASAALTQESADLQQASTPAQVVGTANFSILSQAWNLVLWSSPNHGYSVAFTGAATRPVRRRSPAP